MNKLVAWLAIALLVAIALLSFTMPRVDLSGIARRQDVIERELSSIHDMLREIGADGDSGRVTALLANIDRLDAVVMDFREVIDGMALRVARLEQWVRHPPNQKAEADAGLTGLPLGSYTVPVDLSDELKRTARELFASRDGSFQFEEFLSVVSEHGLLGVANLSADDLDALRNHFDLFKATRALIDYAQNVFVQEEVARLYEQRVYDEVSITDPLPTLDSHEVGIIFIQNRDKDGLRRVFHLPLAAYPEVQQFNEWRDNANENLIRLIGSVTE